VIAEFIAYLERLLEHEPDPESLKRLFVEAEKKLLTVFGPAGTPEAVIADGLMLEAAYSRVPREAARRILCDSPRELAERVLHTGQLASEWALVSSPQEQENWVGYIAEFWRQNRVSLVADGFSAGRCRLPNGGDLGRAKLYPTRPLPPPASPPPDKGLPSSLYGIVSRIAQLRGCCPHEYPGCDCEERRALMGLSPQEVRRIEGDRRLLFDLSLEVIGCLREELCRGEAGRPWERSLGILQKALTAEDIMFYLDMDRLYWGVDIRTFDLSRPPSHPNPGGLTYLFSEAIGTEVELKVGLIRKVREAVRGLPGLDPDAATDRGGRTASYFDFTDPRQREQLHEVLSQFRANNSLVLSLSADFRVRISNALGGGFRKGPRPAPSSPPEASSRPESSLVDRVIDEWESQERKGSVSSPEEFIRHRYEGLPSRVAEEVRAGFLDFVKGKRRVAAAKGGRAGAARDEGPDNAAMWRPGVRLVPGYQLEAYLGRGSYGEVWRAAGPGGPAAIKIVWGKDGEIERELHALKILSGVRHDHLIRIVDSWHLPGHLVIALELADRSLRGRLEEANMQRHAGIPGAELLRYMAGGGRARPACRCGGAWSGAARTWTARLSERWGSTRPG
jgi:hypothetical protein